MIGHNVNDEFDVSVKFPEDYQAKELAGKDATFKVVLHEIKKRELPELDDEFAKDVSEFDTLDAYKANIKETIGKRKADQAEDDVKNQLIDQLIANMTAEVRRKCLSRRWNAAWRTLRIGCRLRAWTSSCICSIPGWTKPGCANRSVRRRSVR